MAMIMAPATTLVPVTTMTDAVGDTWRAIRLQHRELPAVTLSIVPGRGSGHAGVDWDADTPSLKVGARTVADGPEAILGWLLHQAAHGLLAARGRRPGGNEARYHPAAYRDAAESVGLEATHVSQGLGWADTSLSNDLADTYGAQLKQLDAAMASWTAVVRDDRNGIAATCSCDPPRTIRLWGKGAADDLEARPVICSVCGQPFTP